MSEFVVEFEFEKETKNTIRYKEVGRKNQVGTIYVQKHVLPEPTPEKITVTVKYEA